MSEQELEAYETLLAEKANEEVTTMEMTWADKKREEGVLIGMQQLILRQLEERFGPLPDAVRKRLDAIHSKEELNRLASSILMARSLQDTGLA